jgi:hypothetical protein
VSRVFNIDEPHNPIDLVGPLTLTPEIISKEKNFNAATTTIAELQGGPITQTVLETLRKKCVFIDTYTYFTKITVRTHFIQPGEIPCHLKSWHNDFDFGTDKERLRTINYLFLSGPPYTQFLTARELELPFDPSYVLDSWTKIITLVEPLPKFDAPAGQIVAYNATELHRAQPWLGSAPTWRYFFRATAFPNSFRATVTT